MAIPPARMPLAPPKVNMNDTIKYLSQNMQNIKSISFIKSNYVKFQNEFSDTEPKIEINFEYDSGTDGVFNILHQDGIKGTINYLPESDYNQCLSIVEDCLGKSIEEFTDGIFFYLQIDETLVTNTTQDVRVNAKGLFKRKVRFA